MMLLFDSESDAETWDCDPSLAHFVDVELDRVLQHIRSDGKHVW